MRIRSKVWLLVGVSVVLTAGATYFLRTYAMRRSSGVLVSGDRGVLEQACHNPAVTGDLLLVGDPADHGPERGSPDQC